MRKLILVLILIILHGYGFAQRKAIAMPLRFSVIYFGVDNPIGVVAQSMPCESLVLICNNALIEKDKDCTFHLNLKSYGPKCEIVVGYIRNKDTIRIDSMEYRVKRPERPSPSVFHKRNSSIEKANLLGTSAGIQANIEWIDWDYEFIVTSYTVTFLRKSGTWEQINVTGPYFSDQVKKTINSLETGDRLAFSKIMTNGREMKYYINDLELENFELTIQ